MEDIKKIVEEIKKGGEQLYCDVDLLTDEDIGKEITITTVKDRDYIGKLTRIGRNQIEIEPRGSKLRIIIYKHAIISMYFTPQIPSVRKNEPPKWNLTKGINY